MDLTPESRRIMKLFERAPRVRRQPWWPGGHHARNLSWAGLDSLGLIRRLPDPEPDLEEYELTSTGIEAVKGLQ